MRCSNIGPRGARNWFRVLDSPRQLLSPGTRMCSRGVLVASSLQRVETPSQPRGLVCGLERCAPPGTRRHPLRRSPSPPRLRQNRRHPLLSVGSGVRPLFYPPTTELNFAFDLAAPASSSGTPQSRVLQMEDLAASLPARSSAPPN